VKFRNYNSLLVIFPAPLDTQWGLASRREDHRCEARICNALKCTFSSILCECCQVVGICNPNGTDSETSTGEEAGILLKGPEQSDWCDHARML
jgi:hypothetical protein